MIGGDLFEKGNMSLGLSCGCISNWFSNFLIGKYIWFYYQIINKFIKNNYWLSAIAFPSMSHYLNQYVFIVFITIGISIGFIVFFKLPEAKSQQFERDCDIS